MFCSLTHSFKETKSVFPVPKTGISSLFLYNFGLSKNFTVRLCKKANTHWMYNLAVFKIAKANDVRLPDMTSRFLEQKHYSDLLCDDGIHPNEKGHALIARIIRESYIE